MIYFPVVPTKKKSKGRSAMKWWSKCISMIVTKTAGRNVGFKVNINNIYACLQLTHHKMS